MAWDAGEEFERQLDEEQLGTPEAWYWCTRHHRVEQGGQCPARLLLGPYPSAEAASHALESVQKHNEAWDAQDEPRRPADGKDGSNGTSGNDEANENGGTSGTGGEHP